MTTLVNLTDGDPERLGERHIVAPTELFYDSGNDDADHMAMLSLRLIHPDDAVTLVAQGGVEPNVHPARVWSDFRNDRLGDYDVGINQGRMDLAEEQITAAIEQGRLRCVFVRHGTGSEITLPPALRAQLPIHDTIMVIPRSALEGGEAVMTWDDGPHLSFESPGRSWSASEFLLFWDEVTALHPTLGTEFQQAATPEATAYLRRSDEMPRLLVANRDRRKPGRKAKPWGRAIAGLIARASEHGAAESLALGNKTLGEWLREEWGNLGQTLPAIEDAGRDARAIIEALHSALSSASGGGEMRAN